MRLSLYLASLRTAFNRWHTKRAPMKKSQARGHLEEPGRSAHLSARSMLPLPAVFHIERRLWKDWYAKRLRGLHCPSTSSEERLRHAGRSYLSAVRTTDWKGVKTLLSGPWVYLRDENCRGSCSTSGKTTRLSRLRCFLSRKPYS